MIVGAVGVLSWIGIGEGRGIGTIRWALIALAGGLGCVPPIARFVGAGLDRLRDPSPRARNWTTLLVGFISAMYFILTAINQGRDLFPKTHDDCSYMIGMQMLAHGRLWEPALPLPDFFDSFYILVRPVYCSLYFPGTALLYVPTIWLHLPTWLMPAMVAGAVVAMMYRVVSEILDGAAGALAALITASLSWFRVYSILLTSHVPMLLMGLLLFWAWLQWRKKYRLRWAAMIGVMAGWAAITRPADAVIFAVPVGCAVLWELLRQQPPNVSLHSNAPADFGTGPDRPGSENAPQVGIMLSTRKRLLVPVVIALTAMPFLALQIVFNIGVTGHALQSPYGYYLEQDQPGSSFGFHAYNAAARPQSTLPEKQENYEQWVRPYLQSHTFGQLPKRWTTLYFPMIADTTLPCRGLLVLVPIGLLGLTSLRRWIMWLTLPMFVLIYAFNPFFLEHYALLAIPAMVLSALLGGHVLAHAFPRVQKEITAAFVLMLFVVCATSLWEVNRFVSTAGTEVDDETFKSDYLKLVDLIPYASNMQKPAVVLFTYHGGKPIPEEPVYNTDVAWPDNAPIIRAHDLGPARNREIFAYYARTQPDRTFYLFDWSKALSAQGPLQGLGTARELAARADKKG